MSLTANQAIELEQLGRNGRIDPDNVVEFARNPETALHSRFDWDDSSAAHQHRLWQARQVIRVYVKTMPVGDNLNRPTRVYVRSSMIEDDRSGYVTTQSTISVEESRNRLIVDMLLRMLAIYNGYPLPELDQVANIIRSTIVRYRPEELDEAG